MKKTTVLPILLFAVCLNVYCQSNDLKTQFFEGIKAEEIDGDLDKAISIYENILVSEDVDRTLAARCLYHIGICHDKKASGQAMDYFVKLLERYPDQADLADLTRSRITKLEDKNTFIDPRDGHKYKWVKIGNQIWMAENLAYMPWVNPPRKQEYGIWVYDYEGFDLIEAKSTENYQKYGCLYDWPTAMGLGPEYLEKEWGGDSENHQGLCPPGWRIPSDQDWMSLESYLGMPDTLLEYEGGHRAGSGTKYRGESYSLPAVGLFLKSTSNWISGSNGFNSSGFNGLPAGYRWQPSSSRTTNKNADFDQIGELAGYLSSTEYLDTYRGVTSYEAIGRYLTKQNPGDFERDLWMGRSTRYSVRCLKNRKGQTTNDYSEESYPTIKSQITIATQQTINNNSLLSDSLLFSSKHYKSDNWSKFGRDHHNTGHIQSSIILDQPIKTDKWLIDKNIYSLSVVDNIAYCRGKDSTIYSVDLNNGALIWKFKAETTIKSNPTVSHNMVFFAGNDGSRRDTSRQYGTLYLYALDQSTGKTVWQLEKSSEPSWNPVIVGDTMYVGLGSNFSAIDIMTGAEIWNYPINEARRGVHSGLALYDNLAIFGTNSKVIAINIETRKIEWEFGTYRPVFTSPCISQGIVFFGGSNNYFYALDALTGEKLWRYYTNSTFNWASPGVANGYVYFGSHDHNFYCVDISIGQAKWKHFKQGETWGNTHPAISDSFVVIGTRNRQLLALDQNNGKVLWKYENNYPSHFTNPIIYKNKIICGGSDGLYVFSFNRN